MKQIITLLKKLDCEIVGADIKNYTQRIVAMCGGTILEIKHNRKWKTYNIQFMNIVYSNEPHNYNIKGLVNVKKFVNAHM